MKAEKTAEQILNSHFSRPRSPDFERNVLAVMEEYAQSRTEQLQKENAKLKQENERLKVRLKSLEEEYYINRRM